ncbi:hypothetical protein M0813_16850 [Anaeramoeba flamelloides]|uniref:Autophagy-related protein 13 n=1 Tax=Anaeramoeba flamelloides TaxID=1746091 RepID=A0ABQ8YY68_9EUKA|nr:hypothetical protein M0813_16850 [Anaeramoeba flamelloides]
MTNLTSHENKLLIHIRHFTITFSQLILHSRDTSLFNQSRMQKNHNLFTFYLDFPSLPEKSLAPIPKTPQPKFFMIQYDVYFQINEKAFDKKQNLKNSSSKTQNDHFSNGVLLERWKLLCCSVGRKIFYEHAKAINSLSVLLRSVLSFTRMMPTQKIMISIRKKSIYQLKTIVSVSKYKSIKQYKKEEEEKQEEFVWQSKVSEQNFSMIKMGKGNWIKINVEYLKKIDFVLQKYLQRYKSNRKKYLKNNSSPININNKPKNKDYKPSNQSKTSSNLQEENPNTRIRRHSYGGMKQSNTEPRDIRKKKDPNSLSIFFEEHNQKGNENINNSNNGNNNSSWIGKNGNENENENDFFFLLKSPNQTYDDNRFIIQQKLNRPLINDDNESSSNKKNNQQLLFETFSNIDEQEEEDEDPFNESNTEFELSPFDTRSISRNIDIQAKSWKQKHSYSYSHSCSPSQDSFTIDLFKRTLHPDVILELKLSQNPYNTSTEKQKNETNKTQTSNDFETMNSPFERIDDLSKNSNSMSIYNQINNKPPQLDAFNTEQKSYISFENIFKDLNLLQAKQKIYDKIDN